MFVGTGTTITFASSFFAEVIDITPPGWSRESIPTSHMTTSDYAHTFMPAKLVDYGELGIEMAFVPGTSPPIDDAAEAIVISFSDSASSTWSFDGFLTGYEPSDPLEDRALATATVKVTGKVTIA